MEERGATVWPSLFPTYMLCGMMLGCMCAYGLWVWWSAGHEAERFYAGQYLHSGLFRANPNAFEYRILQPSGAVSTVYVAPKRFHESIGRTVYPEGIKRAFEVPFGGALLLLLVGVVAGGIADTRRNKAGREGRVLRGPVIVEPSEFQRRQGGDGLAFEAAPGEYIRIKADREAHHIQVVGDSGAGKSTVCGSILAQVEERGDIAVVLDPTGEYVERRFCASRGDIILNPTDARCPYWLIADEYETEAEAKGLTRGIWPENPRRSAWFDSQAASILAYMLAVNKKIVTTELLGSWLSEEKALDKVLAGSGTVGSSIDPRSADQRNGLVTTLAEFGSPLRMMPKKTDGMEVFSVKEWVAERRGGWIFITSTPATKEALRPLQTLWIDMLIMRLQSWSEPQKRGWKRVWLVMDELASANQIPQLVDALTKMRKFANPIVLGFQGMAQIEDLYGEKKAEIIVSQAFTNIYLRTSESKAAHHLSMRAGKQEIERIRETRPASGRIRGRSFNTERLERAAVLDSEIQGLDDLHGYFVQKGLIVPIEFTAKDYEVRATGFIPREIPGTPEDTPPCPPEEEKYPKAGTFRDERRKELKEARKQSLMFLE